MSSGAPAHVISGLLISDKKKLASEFRLRRSPYNFRSVHQVDVENLVDKGWEVRKEGKYKTKLRQKKPHNQSLEDRIWCLFYKMGYPQLSGDGFCIEFDRDDGSTGKKQIDVFALDEETAFVIECKSKVERGRRSLQKDIQETVSLQNYIRQAIFRLFGKRPKPKVIWAYATNNIIWSEPDVNRANDGGIAIITENEHQYFEAFIKHLGPAGRFQILGEFLKGQKIPGLGEMRLPAIMGKIGGEKFYSFVATPRRLLKIAFINHQAFNHPDGRPAYQRMISSSRIKDINRFITHGGYFPTNILINFAQVPKFELITNKLNTDPNIKFGWITLPSRYRSAWIIDGQHRLYGYSNLDEGFLDQSLFVLAFEKMKKRKEADLFITINHKQKSVPKSLLVSLLADLRLGDPDPRTALTALASAAIRTLNNDNTSPLFRRFAKPGLPAMPGQDLTISETEKGFNRAGLLGRAVHKTRLPGPMSGSTDPDTIERTRQILNGYFEKVRSAHPGRWEAGRTAYIAVNPGIRAHLMLIGDIITYLQHKKNVDFIDLNEDQFINYICDVAKPVFEYIARASDEEIKGRFSRKFGEGGVREYLYNLSEIIYERFDDFGSEEFQRYVTQKESDLVGEANQFIISLYQLMMDCVIQTLKEVHGTKILESGDPAYWEQGIESRRVKDNAYKRQQEAKPDRRSRKEAYLEILDLKEIIQQPNNWHHFSGAFNAPKPGEKKGKKYYTSWMADFNELRRIPAHKSALRTYSDQDFEFLDWLRSEIYPKLKGAVGGSD